MIIRILSDLHLEFAEFEPPVVPADVVILAGDIHVGDKALPWIQRHFQDTPVIYVPGNHEYYGQVLPKHTVELRQRCAAIGVHLLDEDAIDLAGMRFLGCTLWTDFELFGGDPRLAGDLATRSMNDYRKIRVLPQYRKLRSIDTALMHAKARRWLADQLANGADQPTVVISHHAPSLQSVPAHYQTDPLTPAYASRLDDLIAETKPALWIHGHTHNSSDYRIGDTRVLCNPRGYVPDEPNPDFAPALCVTLPT